VRRSGSHVTDGEYERSRRAADLVWVRLTR